MISKELFKEILGIDLLDTDKRLWVDNTSDTTYVCWDDNTEVCDINIYELAHLCKEWAHNKRYIIKSGHDNVPTLWEAYVNLSLTVRHSEVGDTEYEAIFAIGEWILNQEKESK